VYESRYDFVYDFESLPTMPQLETLHSNCVGLPYPINQLVTNKQPIQLTSQTMTLEKTLEEILRNT
jgi:hypothetical protein